MHAHSGHAFSALLGSHACAYTEATLHRQRAQPCSHGRASMVPDCGGPTWQWLEVGACSAPCGGGLQVRLAKCVNAAGEWLPDDSCPSTVPQQPPAKPCNTRPCKRAVWQAKAWGACLATGVRERQVACMSAATGEHSVPVDPVECEALERPVQQELCKSVQAELSGDCTEEDCFQGSCSDDGTVCICESGWHGRRCDAREECAGLSSEFGECCPGLRSADKMCCGPQDVLDRDGTCCAPTNLDACRVCGGSATVVDLLGQCGAGVLDAEGMLCTSKLDECGVCDGTGLSCDMQARAAAAFVNAAGSAVSADDNLLQDATQEARALVSGKLQLQGDGGLVLSAAAGVVQRIGAHSMQLTVAPLQLQLQFSPLELSQQRQAAASTFWLRNTLDDLVSGVSIALGEDAQALQQEAAAPDSPAVQVLLSRVDHVGRAGVCGNGVCEVGELVAVAADGTVAPGCAQDCPAPVLACPLNATGATCSGRGLCIFGTGACSCAAGHIGAACETCAPMYKRINGYCVAPLVAVTPEVSRSSPDPVPLLVAILVAVLVVTCVSVFCVTRRHMAGIYDECDCCCCPQSPELVPTPPPHPKNSYAAHVHTSSRNWFGRGWACARRTGSPMTPINISGGSDPHDADSSNAGSSSLFVPMPSYAAARDGDSYAGCGSKGSRLSSDLELGGMPWRECDQAGLESPAVGTVPTSDLYMVASTAGGVLSSGRSVEEGLRICVPGSKEPRWRYAARDPAILTTDSGQWKQAVKAETPAKVQSEGGEQVPVGSQLPTKSEWGVPFSSGASSWNLSGGLTKMGEVETTPDPMSSSVPLGDSQLQSTRSTQRAPTVRTTPLPPMRPQPTLTPSPPSMLRPRGSAARSLRERASAARLPQRPAPPPPASVAAANASSSVQAVTDVEEARSEEPMRRTRSGTRGWRGVELATIADTAGKPWSVGPSPVHTPNAWTPRAGPARTASNVVWTKGLWSLDGSGSGVAEVESIDDDVYIGPTESELTGRVMRLHERSGNGATLLSAQSMADCHTSAFSDVMPQSTDVGIDCYRSSTALTSVEQTQSIASRAVARPAPPREQLAGEFYGSESDGGTLPWMRAGSTAMSLTSASPEAVAVAPTADSFVGLGRNVSDLMQRVQAMQSQVGGVGLRRPGGEAECQGHSAGGGTSLGSLLDVPSELRADPTGSVNFIYGGALTGPRDQIR
eukprot:jgi/Ulvmu1/10034/UM059_0083.1